MQSTPRTLPFKSGDKVTIKSGRIGGYIMRSAAEPVLALSSLRGDVALPSAWRLGQQMRYLLHPEEVAGPNAIALRGFRPHPSEAATI